MDLVDLLKRSEGKALESKRDLSGPDGALKIIVAFANTASGTLRVGVEDRTGHVRGVAESLDLEERLANLVSDHIAPRFDDVATRSRVTLFTARVGGPALDETAQAIIDALAEGMGLLTSEIAAAIGLTPRATRTRLARLVGSGLLRELGTGPEDPKRRYFRVD